MWLDHTDRQGKLSTVKEQDSFLGGGGAGGQGLGKLIQSTFELATQGQGGKGLKQALWLGHLEDAGMS